MLAAPGAASRLVVSWSGEASASRFISTVSGLATVPALPSRWLVLACLDAVEG